MSRLPTGTHPRLLSTAHPFALAAVVTLTCALLLFSGYLSWHTHAQARLKEQTLHEVSQLRARMGGVLDANLRMATALATFVTSRPDLDRNAFSTFSTGLLESSKPVARYFTYAPGHIIRHVHPQADNESALGADLRTHPDFAASVELLERNGASVLSGPHSLLQGGEQLIAREPLLREGPAPGVREVWGHVSMSMNMYSFYQQAGIGDFTNAFDLAIRTHDDSADSGRVFHGDADLFSTDAVRLVFDVPGDSWEIAARPRNGWNSAPPISFLFAAALGLIAVFLITFRTSRQTWLLHESEVRARKAELALDRVRGCYRELADGCQDVVFETDATGTITYINPAWELLANRSIESMQGKPWTELLHPDDRTEVGKCFGELTEGLRTRLQYDSRLDSLVEETRWVYAHLVPRIDVSGKIAGTVGTLLHIAERKRSDVTVRHQSLRDSLTGLPNRTLLMERLSHALRITRRLGKTLALLYIDLDNFRPINVHHGREVGDQVLCEIARRLRTEIREVDTAARIGGDKFVVLIESIEDVDGIHIVADKVLSALTEPIEAESAGRRITCRVGASIGIALAPRQGTDVDTLLLHADQALDAAKAAGKGCIAPGSGID